MTSATGAECPMHAAGASSTSEAAVVDCIMTAPCHAPASALALLLPIAGVLTDSVDLVDAGVAPLAPPAASPVITIAFTLDTPPPRPAA